MITKELLNLKCPYCKVEFSVAATPRIHGSIVPKPGDRGICFNCGEILVFSDENSLRKPTAEEHQQALANPYLRSARHQIISRGPLK